MPSTEVPSFTTILVIGGGPSGSYCASVLAREGFKVILMEAAVFPRYHVGESLLPSTRPFLQYIGAEEKVIQHGFTVKPGAAFKFNQFKREGYTNFISMNKDRGAWNVDRSRFDEILLRHAQESGATVFEGYKITEIIFDSKSSSGGRQRPVKAEFKRRDGSSGSIGFDYLVDASGRNGIMSTKYLKNRKMNSSLKNIATWGYWRGGKKYRPGSSRENAPWFEALTDETGWSWYIPLSDGSASVGIVVNMDDNCSKKGFGTSAKSLKEHYISQIRLAPGLNDLLKNATLVEDGSKAQVQSASDFSYSATHYAGDHFRLIGDASAFIDPLFSSGIHLALSGAFSAAASIAASIRGHCTEIDAYRFHDAKVSISYTRFLLVVLGAYKQIRAQQLPVMSDVDEDNFDRAFEFIRPIIQGAADVGKKLTEEELHRTMDFVTHVLVTPTQPETFREVAKRLPSNLLDPTGPIMLTEEIDEIAKDDEEAKFVLKEVNARKPIHTMYDGPKNLAHEIIDGWHLVAQRGELGLSQA